jgi:polyphosphate kinase 2 (PPK2 family)
VTRKNVGNYIKKVSDSLDTRESGIYGIEINSDDIFGDEDDVSIEPKKVFRKELYGLQVELIKLQNWLDKTGKTVIIVFEGRDGVGKGSTIKKFTENINPKFFNVIPLGIPTPDERKNWWERYKSQIRTRYD